jgi:hypothetical protein
MPMGGFAAADRLMPKLRSLMPRQKGGNEVLSEHWRIMQMASAADESLSCEAIGG